MTQSVASFRDPAGSCYVHERRVVRTVGAENVEAFEAFQKSACCRSFGQQRQIVSTRRLDSQELASLLKQPEWGAMLAGRTSDAVYEHELIPFQSYPYEWPPEMLWEAGRLTLELALGSVAEGYGLKDATPYNIMFRGPNATFLDIASFEPRQGGDPVWQPYGQFVRTFILPLLVCQQWGVPLADVFINHRDGLEPQDVYRFCSFWDKLKPQILSMVSMPVWLQGKARAEGEQLYRDRTMANAEKARFIFESLLRQLRRSLDKLRPATRKQSLWSDYMQTHSYSEPAFAAKERFVDQWLAQARPRRVLDVGANTGHFSFRAAKAGAEVVSLDLDPACVGSIWQQSHEHKLNVLPLVVNLARPCPALGWRYRECRAFLDRARGAFDCVMMLAVIHHLQVTERIPLGEILSLAAELTTDLLIIEYVAPEDDMFRHLTRGRDSLHTGQNQAAFEAACAPHFDILKSEPLPGTKRRMYALKRKTQLP